MRAHLDATVMEQPLTGVAKTDAIHIPWNGGVPGLFSMVTVVTTLLEVLPLEIPGQ